MNYKSDPLFWQRFLKSAGFYSGSLDASFGPESSASALLFEAHSDSVANAYGCLDPRSEVSVRTLQIPAQRKARVFLKEAQARLGSLSVSFRVISGTRTYEEQNAIYAQGRSARGSVVTNARGGYSNHNFGVAWDIGIFSSGKYLDESPLYRAAGQIGKGQGLEWGGDWKNIQDEPHFQAISESRLTLTRKLFESGDSYLS